MLAATHSADAPALGSPPLEGPPAGLPFDRARALALVALLVTFVAGLAGGWALAHRTGHSVGGQAALAAGESAPFAGRPRGARGAALRERLQLTPAQQARVDSVLERRRPEIAAFWEGPGRSLRAILDSTRADVRAVLDPAQRAVLDSADAARRRRDAERGRGGFGAPPGLPPGGVGPF